MAFYTERCPVQMNKLKGQKDKLNLLVVLVFRFCCCSCNAKESQTSHGEFCIRKQSFFLIFFFQIYQGMEATIQT